MGKDKKTIELDKYESGIIFHSLNEKRNQMLKEGRATDAVDDILLKVIDLMERPEKGKRRRNCHEER